MPPTRQKAVKAFKCDECDRHFPLRMRTVLKAAHTCYCMESETDLVVHHVHVQLCPDCANFWIPKKQIDEMIKDGDNG